jgi:two-component system, chemotaxis family, response regulator Rcp1
VNTVATVLLVEDNPGDIRLTQESFRAMEGKTDLHFAYDGPDALAFLRREGIHLKAPRPDLILLDLNLPKMNGLEVLSNIKSDPSLRTIPTIILTTSQAEKDVLASYQLQANCYLRKPEEWDEFERVMRSTFEFWLKKVKLPLRKQDTGTAISNDDLRSEPKLSNARVITAENGTK